MTPQDWEAVYDELGREVGYARAIRTQRVAPQPPPPDHPAWESALLAPGPTGDLLVARDLDDALRRARR